MKVLIMLALVVSMSAVSFSLGQEKMTKTAALVREIDDKLTAALKKGDSAFVDATLAGEYLEIDAQGLARHKPDIMAIVRARASAPRLISLGPEISVDEISVRTYGETAIFTGLTTTKYQHMEYQGSPQPAQISDQSATYQTRFMRVYSRLNGRWQLLASQTTGIAKR